MYFGAENGAGGAGQERHRPGIRRGTSRESAGEPTDDLTEAPAEELPREPADALTGDQPMLCRGFSQRSAGDSADALSGCPVIREWSGR